MGGIVAWDRVAVYFARALALLTAIPFHEAAHAWVADKLGDPTAKLYGRLSLNPLRHLDPLGALCMIFAGFGWARPVPWRPLSASPTRARDMALSAAAGPVANLLLAYVYTVLYKLVGYLAPANAFWLFVFLVLSTMVNVNITLAVFNLLPVPPLDGSRIFNLLLPKRWYFAVMRYERIILLALFAVLFLGFLDAPLGWLYTAARAPSGFCHRLCGACAAARFCTERGRRRIWSSSPYSCIWSSLPLSWPTLRARWTCFYILSAKTR